MSEPAKKLSDRNDPNSMPSRHLDQIEVAFEIIIPGYQVSRFTTDGCFQDLVVIGITTYLQLTGSLHNVSASRNQPYKCLYLAGGIPKPSDQSWPAKDFGNFSEL